MLDERFESYLEDVDFGLRCAAAGRSGVYEPAAVAYHEGSATLGRWHPATVRRIARNQILLIAKHYPRSLITTQLWRIFVAHVLWGMLAARNGHFLAWFRGKLEGLAAFRSLRPRDGEQAAAAGIALEPVLAESEARIREFQRQSGFDTYWRLYFALT
jgi:GT2 family glycosyltransferase